MQGLWTIEFGSNVGVYGSGVIVMRDGKIQGGDASYYYDGSYEVPNPTAPYPKKLKAKIAAKPFLPGAISVFKTFGEDFTLDLDGTLKDENNAIAIGKPEGIPGMNMRIRMIRRPEAA
jgi:hypothetical protein